MSLLVFGHKNPDTDSICSAISLAHLKNKLGIKATAYALGDIRK
ncbi:DHH family phosphoesterase [Clostridioides difficile]|nr:DHH family phosphoesterase [Clostridioides difficile]EQG11529.1 DHH family protein [Clostridioides difficile 6042]